MAWSCPHCTLINESSYPTCDGCGSLKTEEVPSTSTGQRGGWMNAIKDQLSNFFEDFSNAVKDTRDELLPMPKPDMAKQPSPYNVFDASNVPSDDVVIISPPDARSPPLITIADSPAREAKSPDTMSYDNIGSPRSCQSLRMKDNKLKDDKNAAIDLKRIEALCRHWKTNFIDDSFPPTAKSIGQLYDREDAAIPGRLKAEDIEWLRPTQMYTKDGKRFPWAVFTDPSSSDIEQGALGDCWFLSALALIAERPDVLSKIVLTPTYNSIGVYQIRLCVDGQWRVITVDDHFPCRRKSRYLAFAVGRKNQLWVPLVEKAYAKALGSYERLRAGRTVQGLAILTGAPCESMEIDEKDEGDHDLIWAQLLSANEACYIMGASCATGRNQTNGVEARKMGLLTEHAYSILDVVQEGEHRLLRLRNPWGSHVWTGKWSDECKDWPHDMKKRLLNRQPETGAFWISYEDFLKYFDSVDLAKIRDHLSWSELRVSCKIGGSFGKDAIALMMIVEEPTEVFASLFRGGSRTGNDCEDLLICVHNVDPRGRVGEMTQRSRRSLSDMTITGDVFLHPGHYVIVMHSLGSFARGDYRLDATLVVHSNKRLFGEAIACPPQMATDSLVYLALKDGKQNQIMDGVVSRFVTNRFGGLLVMVDNSLQNKYIHVMADASGSTNTLSSRNALVVKDTIPPMSRQIMIILSQFDASNGYSMESRLSIKANRLATLPPEWIEEGGTSDGKTGQHIPPFAEMPYEILHGPRSLFY